jgi:purine nucleosidase
MQAAGRGAAKPPIGIALEGELATRIDAAMAIAMLNGLSARGEARVISLSVSRTSLKAAQFVDVVASFYSGRPAGGSTMVGMPDGPVPIGDAPALAAILATRGADGSRPYTSNIASLIDTADNAVLIRNVLLAQNDDNASIVLAGPASGLARLISLNGARPQVAAKVRHLVVAVGAYPSGPADAAIRSDIAAARKVFADWPTPIVAVGPDVGAAIAYPGASIQRDFTWSPAHPIADAYRAYKAMPYDAPATALAAALFAVHPDENLFKLSEPGTITVLDDGRTQFAAGAAGTHRYLVVDPAQSARVAKIYTDMVSAQPAPRPGRGGRGAAPAPPQQQQQAAPARGQQAPAAQPAAAAAPKPPAP